MKKNAGEGSENHRFSGLPRIQPCGLMRGKGFEPLKALSQQMTHMFFIALHSNTLHSNALSLSRLAAPAPPQKRSFCGPANPDKKPVDLRCPQMCKHLCNSQAKQIVRRLTLSAKSLTQYFHQNQGGIFKINYRSSLIFFSISAADSSIFFSSSS
mgnify:CR=1 FL=1